MSFKMKYTVETQYLTKDTKRRSGILMPHVGFIVAHDTGNDGSTAAGNVGYYENSNNEISASAHTFIDHKRIIECIPATTGKPEKAWHVIYNVETDNAQFGDDANDIAIGVELCYSFQKGSIDNKESYKRYVWYMAYLCYKFDLNPAHKIVGHNELDPNRKSDPYKNALKIMGITQAKFLADVAAELADCITEEKLYTVYQDKAQVGSYASYADAVREATKLTNSYVAVIATGAWVWTNIPKVEESEDDQPMKMEDWQKTLIVSEVTKWSKVVIDGEPVINSPQVWIDKVKNGTLTAGELSTLTFAIVSRAVKK